MKKLLIIALILISATAWAESVAEMNGFDWMILDTYERAMYVAGFYSAYVSVYEEFESKTGDPELLRELQDRYFFALNVGEMVDRIDRFYQNYEHRRHNLHWVLMSMGGKDWWNTEESGA